MKAGAKLAKQYGGRLASIRSILFKTCSNQVSRQVSDIFAGKSVT